ncbi:class I adenylate-forming enzyme family protein [Frankia sp. QA3]|uniref:class I adenylate-forming enzyme family protein n=1 Tax=Frankia sp. QA3 TaxID=710111 RepID=UPI000269BDFC|nr:class I adenylate-forming enzyme family protein [Frankia sp. QA3]EIV92841.1 acyl-CoA synthetase (AMP-forming)/AMP-acid ligase II [Frankia sp. QA3]
MSDSLVASELLASPTGNLAERVVGDVLRRAAQPAGTAVDADGGTGARGGAEAAGRALALTAVHSTGTHTWSAVELLADAERVARGLLARLPVGSRVATCLPNGAEAVLIQLGVALAGMVLVPVNPRSRPPELDHALRRSRASCVFAALDVAGNPVADTAAELAASLPDLLEVRRCDGEWRNLTDGGETDRPLPVVDPDGLAQLQFTSGTSGHPKAVKITHHGMVVTSHAFTRRIGLPPGGAWLSPMPLFHTAGNVLGVMGALWQRCELVVLAFEPGRTLRAAAARRATVLSAAPTLLDLLMAHPDIGSTDLSSLQVVFTGGQRVTPAFVERVESTFGARLSATFGMTETCGAALQTSPWDGDDVRRHSVGRPLDGTDVRVATPAGEPAPLGEVGELWLRGTRLTRGYLNDETATSAALTSDGWLRTGDLAAMDSRGVCRVAGRDKDVIKTGGENVSPEEVEEAVASHPSVRHAAVVGLPDERWGELVVAFVVPSGGVVLPAELENHCRSLLSPFKVPRRWHVLDELPTTASSKVRRAELRELAVAAQAAGTLSAGSGTAGSGTAR